MAIGLGINKVISFKKEASFDAAAPVGTGMQVLRRTSYSGDPNKQIIESEEMRSDAQWADIRHGLQTFPVQLMTELAPGGYSPLFELLLRNTFSVSVTTGAVVTIAAAAGPPGTFTRSAGSFITDGFRIGMIVRHTGWTTTAVANNSRNYRIIALTATVMTTSGLNDEVVVTKAAGDSVTIASVGKRLIVSQTPVLGSGMIEMWQPDVPSSELLTGMRVATCKINADPKNMIKGEWGCMARSFLAGTTQFAVTPTAAAATSVLGGLGGYLRLAGADRATVTSATIEIDGNMSTEAVLGSVKTPDIFMDRISVSGQLNVFFDTTDLRDAFLNETEVSLDLLIETNASTLAADFLSFNMPRVKLNSGNKPDGRNGLQQQINYRALLMPSGTVGVDNTTLAIQDSLAP